MLGQAPRDVARLPDIGASRSFNDVDAFTGEFGLSFAIQRAILEAVTAGDRDRAASVAAAHAVGEMRDLIELRVSAPASRDGLGAPAAVLETAAAAVEEVFAAIATVHDEVRQLHAATQDAGQRFQRAQLTALRELLHAQLDRLPIMAGLGMIFAPDILDDEVRWIEWLCASADGPPEPLVTTLDPAAPDYYDYEAAEWYREPHEHGTRWIAGPFVDHSGTDAHIFTLTQPVLDTGGRFLGVAGADLTVDSVETITHPALAAVPGTALLLNHRGRVIAANTSEYLPGTLYRVPTSGSVYRDPRIPWVVLRPPS